MKNWICWIFGHWWTEYWSVDDSGRKCKICHKEIEYK